MIERAFEELPDGGGPPDGWQDKVLARIAEPPPVRRRWPLVVAGSSVLAAAAAAVALFFALRTPATTPVRNDRAKFEQLMQEIDALSQMKLRAEHTLMRAMTEAETKAAKKQLDEAKRKQKAVKQSLERVRRKVVAKCEPNDPLCAIE